MHAPDLLPWCAATQDWFFKLGNTKPEGGFGVGKPPFWERPAYLLWTGAADDQEAEEARLAEVVTGFISVVTKIAPERFSKNRSKEKTS